MNKKPIVFFSFHNSDRFSGATRSLLDIIDQFVKNDTYRLIAVFPTTTGTAIDYLQNIGVEIERCNYHILIQNEKEKRYRRILKFPFFCYWYLQTSHEVKRIVNKYSEYEIAAVYNNTSVNIFGALINKYYGIPNIWHFREYRHDDHGIYFFLGDKYLMRMANRYASIINVISQSMGEYHIQKGIDSKKLQVVYNDVANSSYFEREWNNESESLNILIAGDVKEGKGQLEVLESLMKVRADVNWNLFLAGNFGDTAYCGMVKDFIKANKIEDKVHILGLVKNMNELRKDCNVGIVASKKEAFGRVTVEGMLAGLSMIGSNTGGTKELINHMENGLLYQLGDHDDLVKCIEAMSNKKLRVRLAQKGQQFAIDNFTVGNCYRTIEQEIRHFRRS